MGTNRVVKRGASLFALALLLVTGCGDASGDEAALGTLQGDHAVRVSSRERVDVELTPTAPIKLGKNTIVVSFPDNAHAELVSASALMPAHGHGSPAPAIERADGGDREAASSDSEDPGVSPEFVIRDLVLYMSGRWELRLGLRVDARDDEVIVAVDVP